MMMMGRGGLLSTASSLFFLLSTTINHSSFLVDAQGTPTIVDKLNLAKDRLSPACVNALQGLDASTTAKANFASGRIVEGVNLLFSEGGDVGKILTQGVPTTLGQPDVCHSSTGDLHYCQIGVHGAFIRWGGCVPSQCNGDDMLHALFPPGFESVTSTMVTQCEEPDFHKPTTGTYVMFAFTMLLVLLALLGTWIHHREIEQSLQQPVLPTKVVEEESKVEGGGTITDATTTTSTTTSAFAPILKSFSLIRNMKDLLAPSRGGPMDFFDGIRVFCMLWVIYGHVWLHTTNFVGWSNPLEAFSYNDQGFLVSFGGLVMRGVYYGVDSFFFLAAFLACLSILKGLKSAKGDDATFLGFIKSVPNIYLKRWLRLTPIYAYCIFAYTYFAPVMTEGPYTQPFYDINKYCKKVWWHNLLYINNLMAPADLQMCFTHSWYLGMDFQFFLVVPFVAGLAAYNKYLGLLLPAVLGSASMAMAYNKSIKDGWSTNLMAPGTVTYDDEYYIRPEMRAGGYMLSLMSAIIWYYHGDAIKKALQPRRYVRLALLLASLTLMGLPMFGIREGMAYYPSVWSPKTTASFLVFSNPCWTLGLILMSIILFVQHKSTPKDGLLSYYIKAFLESRPFVVLSRLCYTAYLVHFWVLLMSFTTMYSPVHLSAYWIVVEFMGITLTTLVFTFILHLLVEKPSEHIINYLREPAKKVN